MPRSRSLLIQYEKELLDGNIGIEEARYLLLNNRKNWKVETLFDFLAENDLPFLVEFAKTKGSSSELIERIPTSSIIEILDFQDEVLLDPTRLSHKRLRVMTKDELKALVTSKGGCVEALEYYQLHHENDLDILRAYFLGDLSLLHPNEKDYPPWSPSAQWEHLPPDVFHVIFSFLDGRSLLNVERVCHKWKEHATPSLWETNSKSEYVRKLQIYDRRKRNRLHTAVLNLRMKEWQRIFLQDGTFAKVLEAPIFRAQRFYSILCGMLRDSLDDNLSDSVEKIFSLLKKAATFDEAQHLRVVLDNLLTTTVETYKTFFRDIALNVGISKFELLRILALQFPDFLSQFLQSPVIRLMDTSFGVFQLIGDDEVMKESNITPEELKEVLLSDDKWWIRGASVGDNFIVFAEQYQPKPFLPILMEAIKVYPESSRSILRALQSYDEVEVFHQQILIRDPQGNPSKKSKRNRPCSLQ